MYIEFVFNERNRIVNANGSTTFGSFKDPNALPDSKEVFEFKPTWLVRVSDFKAVSGSSVNEHYWALSYSWNQSGEIIHTAGEEYERNDEARHEILETIDYGVYGRTVAKVYNTNFEGLIQRICQEFHINFIWYDQMCIDQDSHTAKVREIRQMHQIYKNAYCTLALIPELRMIWQYDKTYANIDVISDSQWSKRMWTLEEAYMSKRILFVGRDAHLWSDTIKTGGIGKATTFLKSLRSKQKWSACTVLWHARKRTSHKAHDRVFALVNILPELKDRITISYHQDPRALMLQFYKVLVQKDLSVLLFGAAIEPVLEEDITAARQQYDDWLPSWTGNSGAHITQEWLASAYTAPRFKFGVAPEIRSLELLFLTSDFVLARIEAAVAVDKHPVVDNSSIEYTADGLPTSRASFPQKCVVNNSSMSVTFVSTTNESQDVYDSDTRRCGLKVTHVLPLKVQNQVAVNTLSRPTHCGGYLSLTEECSECIILVGLTFQVLEFRCHPVVKKVDADEYRSIGLCLVDDYVNIDPAIIKPSQEFRIR